MNFDGSLSSKQGFNNQIRSSGDFNSCYGLGLHGLLKPFTTKTNATGVPHYKPTGIIESTNPSGSFKATSEGLNPIGKNTLFEGIVHGSSLPLDLELSIPDKNNARLFGIKNPSHFVGWGYDTFGYPAPNANLEWAGSGAIKSTQKPSGLFKSTSGNVNSGNLVAHTEWLGGPLDLRWDQCRGVWAGWHGGVMAGKVTNISISGGVYSETGTYFAETILYDAVVRDGVANQMTLTGVIHIGPKPTPSSYKVTPIGISQFCFVVHTEDSIGKPKYGLWMIEPPGVEACSGIGSSSSVTGVGEEAPDIYLGASEGSPNSTTKLLTGSGLYHGLRIYPLPTSMGGLGLSSISSGQILIGSTGNLVVARNLVAGSGLQFAYSGSDAVFALSTGTAFVTAGVNSNITALQGLTTPLTIAQGGTGASGKIFVDISGTQSILGLKSFHNGLEIVSGTVNNPGIRFLNTDYGLFYTTSGINGSPSVVVAMTGRSLQYFTSSGVRYTQRIHIFNETTDGYDVPLIVQEHNNVGSSGVAGSGRTIANESDIIQWRRKDGTTLGIANTGGYLKTSYFHSTGVYINDSPFLAEQGSSPSYPSFKVRHNGNTQLQFDPSGDTLRMNMSKTTNGYVRFAGPTGSSVGYIDMSATTTFAGGYLNMSAGPTGNGGYINTANGGGGIDTYNGIVQLGPSGNRLTLNKPSLSTNLELNLPSSGSVITTKEYVDAKTDGVGAGSFPGGLNGVFKLYGSTSNSGDVLYTMTFVSGLLNDMSFIQVTIG